jgi:hypothetical protein
MSAVPPIAPEFVHCSDSTKSAKPDPCTAAKSHLFNHLVGERKQLRRDFEPERLGGLKINH